MGFTVNGPWLHTGRVDKAIDWLLQHFDMCRTRFILVWIQRMFDCKARFLLPELTGDRFPLPVNSGRVDGRAFPLAELMRARVDGPSTRAVNSGSGNWALVIEFYLDFVLSLPSSLHLFVCAVYLLLWFC